MALYIFSPNSWLPVFSKSNWCWNWSISGNRWRFRLRGDLDGENWYRLFLPWDRVKLTTILEKPGTEILRGNFDIDESLSNKCDLRDYGGAGLGPLLLKLRINLETWKQGSFSLLLSGGPAAPLPRAASSVLQKQAPLVYFYHQI